MRGSIRERSPGHWAIILDIVKDGTRKRKWHSFKATKREAQVECDSSTSLKPAVTFNPPKKRSLRFSNAG